MCIGKGIYPTHAQSYNVGTGEMMNIHPMARNVDSNVLLLSISLSYGVWEKVRVLQTAFFPFPNFTF